MMIQEINKFKEIIYGYLDDDLQFTSVLRYINRQKVTKNSAQITNLKSGLALAVRNYKKSVPETKKRRLESLPNYITTPKKIMSTSLGLVVYDVWSFIYCRRTFI
jgi:hypothetical protein